MYSLLLAVIYLIFIVVNTVLLERTYIVLKREEHR